MKNRYDQLKQEIEIIQKEALKKAEPLRKEQNKLYKRERLKFKSQIVGKCYSWKSEKDETYSSRIYTKVLSVTSEYYKCLVISFTNNYGFNNMGIKLEDDCCVGDRLPCYAEKEINEKEFNKNVDKIVEELDI